MAPIKYTAAELLQLKDSHDSQTRLDLVKLSPGLDVIKKYPSHDAGHTKDSKAEVPSSGDSEEQIVFLGKKPRQPLLNLDGETEWKYHGRSRSDRNSNEPVDAPTGIDAQRKEGFKRFFKAVASPTHVRVTAGGRIVPNTRNTASPTAKWDKEQSTTGSDGTDQAKQSSQDAASPGDPPPGPGIPPSMMLPPMFPCYPPMPPMFTPVPYYHVGNGMVMPFGMPQAHPGMAHLAPNPALQGQQQPENKAAESGDNGMGSKKPRPAPIKISPPENFDHTRPYYHGGQVIMPTPPSAPAAPMMHGQLIPFGFNGGYAPPATARDGQFNMKPPMAVASPPAPAPVSAGSAKQSAGYNPSLFAPVKVPVTSIKGSEITKSQLGSLRSQLKYNEDQLQYNRHQIDEKLTLNKIDNLRNLIGQFQNVYKRQVNAEFKGHSSTWETQRKPGMELALKDIKTPPTPVAHPQGQVNAQPLDKSHAANFSGLHHRMKSSDQPRRKNGKDLRQRAGINCSKAVDTTAALGDLERYLMEKREKEGNAIPAFSARTVMAPLFEPRGVTHMPSIAEAAQPSDGTLVAQPYLVGRLPKGMNPQSAHDTDYIYSRELTDEEKRARHIYWGGVSVKGSGLPKFDGKDFYPPSPVKTEGDMTPKARRLPADSAGLNHIPEPSKKSDDPFQVGRDTMSNVAEKTSKKFSHAVPIINPNTLARENVSNVTAKTTKVAKAADDAEGLRKSLRGVTPTSPTKSPSDSLGDKLSTSMSRRTLDRSSKASNNDLWQGMIKKASASSTVVPASTLSTATVSSTTAKDYLQEYLDHAASLSPAANVNGSVRASSSDDKSDAETVRQQPQMEKMDENCPPTKMPTTQVRQDDVIADLHQRMLRDAARRGVIGPSWQ